jgi:hypothetical protein
MRTLLVLLIWYAIFCFITNNVNPMLWNTFAKIFAVIIAFIVIADDD